ncbi:hypothetical protein, partial [Burkholderia multivorans]|uniref:hypothetical protein n=1 Tax=Burkholderia multivorans TaxID=87883 RepID=UPI001C239A88
MSANWGVFEIDQIEGREERLVDWQSAAARTHIQSLSELLCVRHKLMAKEPRYATQTQGRSAGRTGQGLEPGPGTH